MAKVSFIFDAAIRAATGDRVIVDHVAVDRVTVDRKRADRYSGAQPERDNRMAGEIQRCSAEVAS